MCRWIAYSGPEIFLEDLLFHQEYSIASQSLAARESVFTTNGDGFGVAWYGKRTAPGLFKDILPAWNDSNLRSIAAQIQTRLFFAHVRASTGTAVTRTNCHPFTYKHWAFMHNGKIGNWSDCRKSVEQMIAPGFTAPGRAPRTVRRCFCWPLVWACARTPPVRLSACSLAFAPSWKNIGPPSPCGYHWLLPMAHRFGLCVAQAINNHRVCTMETPTPVLGNRPSKTFV
ncbi:MAG: hypothetical protein RJA72_835 [Pseudomonadota bacterium]